MIAHEGGPGLSVGPQAWHAFQMLLDRALADLDTQLEQFSSVALRARCLKKLVQ
jgi:hypothetical protein